MRGFGLAKMELKQNFLAPPGYLDLSFYFGPNEVPGQYLATLCGILEKMPTGPAFWEPAGLTYACPGTVSVGLQVLRPLLKTDN